MKDFFRFSKESGFGVLLVNPPMASVLLSASVERCFVSRMRDFYYSILYKWISAPLLCKSLKTSTKSIFIVPNYPTKVCELKLRQIATSVFSIDLVIEETKRVKDLEKLNNAQGAVHKLCQPKKGGGADSPSPLCRIVDFWSKMVFLKVFF